MDFSPEGLRKQALRFREHLPNLTVGLPLKSTPTLDSEAEQAHLRAGLILCHNRFLGDCVRALLKHNREHAHEKLAIFLVLIPAQCNTQLPHLTCLDKQLFFVPEIALGSLQLPLIPKHMTTADHVHLRLELHFTQAGDTKRSDSRLLDPDGFVCNTTDDEDARIAQRMHRATGIPVEVAKQMGQVVQANPEAALEWLRQNALPQSALNSNIALMRACPCGKYGYVLSKCGGCKSIYYCSKECQINDWPQHKTKCKSK